ncbi:hypothetical protein [Telmatospirillum sp. J64-1]|uniref:hypothetical protein n=1 Tax=Telmatospirillum sp. J64-1 TaxID=2502183 RepID=UPI00115E1A89|nr:hypothetical protein [Telmatospirillum sp. J64-1]
MNKRYLHLATPILAVLALAACTAEKPLIDHVASAGSGKDCSLARAEQGGPYCKEHQEEPLTLPVQVWCYRSVGMVDCFDQPLRGNEDNLVGTQVVPISVR